MSSWPTSANIRSQDRLSPRHRSGTSRKRGIRMGRRWQRYEVVRVVADQNRRGATISRRTATYRFRWMAERQAWRSEAKHAGVGGEVRFIVQEITPEVPPPLARPASQSGVAVVPDPAERPRHLRQRYRAHKHRHHPLARAWSGLQMGEAAVGRVRTGVTLERRAQVFPGRSR